MITIRTAVSETLQGFWFQDRIHFFSLVFGGSQLPAMAIVPADAAGHAMDIFNQEMGLERMTWKSVRASLALNIFL